MAHRDILRANGSKPQIPFTRVIAHHTTSQMAARSLIEPLPAYVTIVPSFKNHSYDPPTGRSIAAGKTKVEQALAGAGIRWAAEVSGTQAASVPLWYALENHPEAKGPLRPNVQYSAFCPSPIKRPVARNYKLFS